jgi:hypothetical protein
MFVVKASQKDVDTLIAALQAKGTVRQISPNNFVVSEGHVNATAVFDPPTGNLTVTINKKPFYITEEHIEKGLEEVIKSHEPVA